MAASRRSTRARAASGTWAAYRDALTAGIGREFDFLA